MRTSSSVAFDVAAVTLGGPWLPAIVLIQLYVIFAIVLIWSARRLPDRVTTQFSLFGRPSNHMRRAVYLVFIIIFGLWVPLSGLGIYFFSKSKPQSMHIPNQAYWLSPAHLAETQDFFLTHWLWFGCLMVGFVVGLHYLIMRANRRQPARLPWPLLIVLLACLAGGLIWWSTNLSKHFANIPAAS